jgi:hypothetical protein
LLSYVCLFLFPALPQDTVRWYLDKNEYPDLTAEVIDERIKAWDSGEWRPGE